MTELILASKILFIKMEGWNYIHIQIKGKGIVVNQISHSEMLDIIEAQNLHLVQPEEYNDYNPKYGKIYTDGNFKNFVNNKPHLKDKLFRILQQLHL